MLYIICCHFRLVHKEYTLLWGIFCEYTLVRLYEYMYSYIEAKTFIYYCFKRQKYKKKSKSCWRKWIKKGRNNKIYVFFSGNQMANNSVINTTIEFGTIRKNNRNLKGKSIRINIFLVYGISIYVGKKNECSCTYIYYLYISYNKCHLIIFIFGFSFYYYFIFIQDTMKHAMRRCIFSFQYFRML